MQRPPTFYTPARLVLPGQSELIKTVGGNYWYVIRASHPRFRVKINNGDFMESGQATGDVYPPDFRIEEIEVINDDPSLVLEIVFKTGEGQPLDNKLNVYQAEVIPSLRDDIPAVIAEAKSVADDDGVGAWVKLLEADALRDHLILTTTAATSAYWFGDNGLSADLYEGRNIVTAGGLSGQLNIRSKSAIYVWHTEAGTEIRATVHKFA